MKTRVALIAALLILALVQPTAARPKDPDRRHIATPHKSGCTEMRPHTSPFDRSR